MASRKHGQLFEGVHDRSGVAYHRLPGHKARETDCDRDVEDRTHDQGGDNPDGQIALRPAAFLGGRRNRVKSDVGEKDNGPAGQDAGNFRGIIGVAHLAGQAAQAGSDTLLTLMAVLSINLALLNLMPIPVLDGGAFLFCLVEWIRGRPAPARVQDFATRAGLTVILCMFFYTTVHDLAGLGVFNWVAAAANAASGAHIIPN